MWTTRFYCSLGGSALFTAAAAFLKLYEAPAWACNVALGIGAVLIVPSFWFMCLAHSRETPNLKDKGER